MNRSLRFRLNKTLFEITDREETVVLDWIRREQRLTGTKEGCREGDCGACMVLLGERVPGEGKTGRVRWKPALSCLLAMGELDGRHVITIEGLSENGLTPVMKAMLDEGASQCGFCSPGFIVSLTGYLVSGGKLSREGTVRAVEGNLCRCTGYGSIQRAGATLVDQFGDLPEDLAERIEALAAAGVIPQDIASLMTDIPLPADTSGSVPESGAGSLTIGGGTDYFVRNPDPEPRGPVAFVDRSPDRRRITQREDGVVLGASVTVQEFFESPIIRGVFPEVQHHELEFASLPIRTRATLAGNITNASPIGDMTAILLALRTTVRIGRAGSAETRELPLEHYFLSYRNTALEEGEYVDSLVLPLPPKNGRVSFNFEKVAKRSHLDIASVNSACLAFVGDGGEIAEITLSAGGVGPVPIRLSQTEEYLRGKKPDRETATRAAEIAASECTPIDDVRGTAAYRRTLLGRFMWAHLAHTVPELDLAKELLA